jgi:hypothetical protein
MSSTTSPGACMYVRVLLYCTNTEHHRTNISLVVDDVSPVLSRRHARVYYTRSVSFGLASNISRCLICWTINQTGTTRCPIVIAEHHSHRHSRQLRLPCSKTYQKLANTTQRRLSWMRGIFRTREDPLVAGYDDLPKSPPRL